MALHGLMNISMASSIFFVQNRNELFKKHKQQTAHTLWKCMFAMLHA